MKFRLKTTVTSYAAVVLFSWWLLSTSFLSSDISTVRQILNDSYYFMPRPVTVRAAYFSGYHGAYIQDPADFGDSNMYKGKLEDRAVLLVSWPEIETEDGQFRLDPSLTDSAKLLRELSEIVSESDDALVLATFDGTVQTKRWFRYIRRYWFFGEILRGTGFGQLGRFKGELEISGVRDIELIALPIKQDEERY
jgi:hypothetical protein